MVPSNQGNMGTEDNGVEPGVAGPDFSLESNEGRQVRLSEFRGRSNVLLYFMREFT
ncbi:MAG: redoxin domain-containing protein [Gemmatimonadetes bacterium]|nr:redoxin domain-containing protein [Gemmatimonadota bacterium]